MSTFAFGLAYRSPRMLARWLKQGKKLSSLSKIDNVPSQSGKILLEGKSSIASADVPVEHVSKVSNKGVDYYVGPAGAEATLPSKGYRYMRYKNDDGTIERNVNATIKNKRAPVTYFGFEKFDTGKKVRDKHQIKGAEFGTDETGIGSWSDGRLRGEFDTLQLFDNKGNPTSRIPMWAGDSKGPLLESVTEAYPEYGLGGAIQQNADYKWIEFDKVDVLPEGLNKYYE